MMETVADLGARGLKPLHPQDQWTLSKTLSFFWKEIKGIKKKGEEEEECRGAATTAGWRKAPDLAQRVCTRGLASPRSISPKNTMNTARFRVVRAAGA